MDRKVAELVEHAAQISTRPDKELHLYDFDGTLFRSPPPPQNWEGPWWYGDAQSLVPPYVPDKPGQEWWVSPVVNSAKASINDRHTFAICCTGRVVDPFQSRISDLLKQARLKFDLVLLNPGMDTKQFKKKVMLKLQAEHDFDSIHIWEDRNQGEFRTFITTKMGIPCVMHTLTMQQMSYE